MRYVSTRDAGGDDGKRRYYTFEEAVLAGWADDGGMLMPETIPKLNAALLTQWATERIGYPELCYEILSRFVDTLEIPHDELRELVTGSFARFGHPDVVTVAPLLPGEPPCVPALYLPVGFLQSTFSD